MSSIEVRPRALLVEDEPLLRAELRDHLEALWPGLDICGEAADGLEAARLLASGIPDVVFLDVRIPGLDGLEVARLVAGRAQVVFVTAHREFAVAAFDEGAVDFIVKPIDRQRLATTLERVKARLGGPPLDVTELLTRLRGPGQGTIRWIQASAGDRMRITAVEDVIYFQAEAKYTKVVAPKGDMHIRRTIKELAASLDGDDFWQVNRGTIVNVARIQEVRRDGDRIVIAMEGRGERLLVTQPYQHLFKRM